MLSRNITISKKVSKVSEFQAKLLYTWLLPFLDDYGRFHADPNLIKGFIFPLEETITTKHIEKMLAELERVGLISLYDVDGSTYLEVVNFDKFQTFRTDRKRQAEYPEPIGKPKTPDGKPDAALSEDKGKEKKTSKDKIDFDALKDAWNDIDWLSGISSMTETRKNKLRERDKEMRKLGVTWDDLFEAIGEQKEFLSGKNTTKWQMGFDWLIANDTNWVKVHERRYVPHSEQKNGRGDPPHPGMIWDERKKAWIYPDSE